MNKKLQMLVVDDEPQILEALSQLFDLDFHVLTASDGVAAISLLKANPEIAIVISDQRMPGMNGVELLKHTKQIAPNSMRILLTGYSDLEAVLDSVNVGEVFRYVRKPWVPETLKSIVALAMASYMLRCQKAARLSKPAASEPINREPIPQRRRTDSGYTPALEIKAPIPEEVPQRRKSDRQYESFEEEYFSEHHLESSPLNIDERVSYTTDIAHLEEEFFVSFRNEAMTELKKFESFEEAFFDKLNAHTNWLGKELNHEFTKSSHPLVFEKPIFEKVFHGRSGKPKILIVDDEARVLSSLSELLKPDYDVLTCSSADTALDVLEGNSFIACIISDMRMPNISGSEFLNQAQSMAPLVPKILMTAYADAEEIVSLVNHDLIFRHIPKPWDVSKLMTSLSEAVTVCRSKVDAGMESRLLKKSAPVLKPISEPVKPIDSRELQPVHANEATMDHLRRLNALTRQMQ